MRKGAAVMKFAVPADATGDAAVAVAAVNVPTGVDVLVVDEAASGSNSSGSNSQFFRQ
jgi:hypothetical protein